ncbi:hypothetical protein [Kineosporia succinea]|uniref:NIPSNAP protein n=1 Tax=Kineosporia succinea TaxID=84632 RepID=A0ABT9P9K3_9ACTN|nr:hypothetical protein [Kineosporia succinea]MDP9829231.1 hypothetical protein [Kineosporia succinea]
MTYLMLAQLQLRYGFAHLPAYTEGMRHVRELFESQGIMLERATVTKVGPLYETWNLWRIDDPGHVDRAMAVLAPTFTQEQQEAIAAMHAVVESEQVRILENVDLPSPSTTP